MKSSKNREHYADLVDGDWVENSTNLWELLTGLILDTRTPLERMALVTRYLHNKSLLDFRVLNIVYRKHGASKVAEILGEAGYPWRNQKSRYFETVPEFDLATATYEQMMSIKGVGPKLASLWMRIVHNEERAVIDVHVYRWLRAQGYDIPLAKYDQLSDVMKQEAAARGLAVSELDRRIVENGIRNRKGIATRLFIPAKSIAAPKVYKGTTP